MAGGRLRGVERSTAAPTTRTSGESTTTERCAVLDGADPTFKRFAGVMTVCAVFVTHLCIVLVEIIHCFVHVIQTPIEFRITSMLLRHSIHTSNNVIQTLDRTKICKYRGNNQQNALIS